MGCGSSAQKNVVAPIVPMKEDNVGPIPSAAEVQKAHKPSAAFEAANRGAPADKVEAFSVETQGKSGDGKDSTMMNQELESSPVVEMGAGVSPTAQISEAVKQLNIPGALEAKDQSKLVPKTDDERSKSTTPYTANQTGLGETSPGVGNNVAPFDSNSSGELPSMAEPLPDPLDVDAIKLPAKPEATESVPYWERDPLPARPGTASRRPMSSGGKIKVYKTEKTKQMEAENKKKRQEQGDSPADVKPMKKASALPPLEERRKKKMEKKKDSENVDVVVQAPVKPKWTGTTGGEAWSVETSEFKGPEPEVLTFD